MRLGAGASVAAGQGASMTNAGPTGGEDQAIA